MRSVDDVSHRSTPVYLQIAQELRERIISGQLNPGDILPSESTLSHDYHISRDTARKSLRELENQGLIFSRPKIGYFVSAPKHASVEIQFVENIPGTSTQYLDISGKLPDPHVQEALQISPASKVIEFVQLIRDENENPIGYDVKYVPYRRAYPSVESEMRFAVFPDITFPHVPPHSYYTKFTIEATVADAKQSRMILCPLGTPLLMMKRLMIDRSGNRIGYTVRYLRQPYASLNGSSGYVDVPAGGEKFK